MFFENVSEITKLINQLNNFITSLGTYFIVQVFSLLPSASFALLQTASYQENYLIYRRLA
jgi:hypothetical protein